MERGRDEISTGRVGRGWRWNSPVPPAKPSSRPNLRRRSKRTSAPITPRSKRSISVKVQTTQRQQGFTHPAVHHRIRRPDLQILMLRHLLVIEEQHDPPVGDIVRRVDLDKEGDLGPGAGGEGEGTAGERGAVLVVALNGGRGAERVGRRDVGVDCEDGRDRGWGEREVPSVGGRGGSREGGRSGDETNLPQLRQCGTSVEQSSM